MVGRMNIDTSIPPGATVQGWMGDWEGSDWQVGSLGRIFWFVFFFLFFLGGGVCNGGIMAGKGGGKDSPVVFSFRFLSFPFVSFYLFAAQSHTSISTHLYNQPLQPLSSRLGTVAPQS